MQQSGGLLLAAGLDSGNTIERIDRGGIPVCQKLQIAIPFILCYNGSITKRVGSI